MARKGKNRKKKREMKRRPRKFNQKQFVEILCSNCCACIWDTHMPNPALCYNELYRHDPEAFTKGPYVNLLKVNSAMERLGRSMRNCSVEQFRAIFCASGICTDGRIKEAMTCNKIKDCYGMFREQMGLTASISLYGNVIDPNTLEKVEEPDIYSLWRKRNKRGKKKYVAEAYPTSFMSSNKEFQEFVARTLHGDNDNKSDKNKESSGSVERDSDSGAEGGKSEVHGGAGEGS